MTEAPNDARRSPETPTGDVLPEEPVDARGSQDASAQAKNEAPPANGSDESTVMDRDEEMWGGRVAEVEALQTELAGVQAKAAEYLDGWQRARAEVENLRRRADKERDDIYQNATVDVLTKLLPVIDDFERALSTVPPERQADELMKGFGLIYRKLTSLLEAAGVQTVDPKGEPFDPHYHEAVGRDEPSPEAPVGHVSTVMQKGYLHGNRVLRPALVRVAQ